MNTLIHADIFFFISTIGLIIIISLLAVVLVYIIGILKSVRHISKKLEGDVENISADAKEFVSDLRSSVLYRMIFGKNKRLK